MKAETSEEYKQQWKNHVAEILYGPVMDCSYPDKALAQRIRDSVTKLCGEIDKVAEGLVKDGTFKE